MIFSRILAAASVICAITAASVVSAQDRIDYRLTWVVEPKETVIPEEAYKKLSKITETRLLPIALYRASADVTAPGGKVLAVAGTQFAALRADVPVICNFHKSGDKRTVAGKKHLCIVDEDADGSFDSYFEKGRDSHYWYVLEGSMRTSKVKELADVRVEEIDPSETIDAPLISANYGRFLDAGNLFQGGRQGMLQSDTAIYFFYEIGSKKRMNLMYRMCVDEPIEPYGCAPAVFPSTVDLLGLEATVLGRNNEDAVLSIGGGFEATELYVEMGSSGYATFGKLFLQPQG